MESNLIEEVIENTEHIVTLEDCLSEFEAYVEKGCGPITEENKQSFPYLSELLKLEDEFEIDGILINENQVIMLGNQLYKQAYTAVRAEHHSCLAVLKTAKSQILALSERTLALHEAIQIN